MSKKYKYGLVLGKFMPLHAGHQHLISSALKGCDNVTVLACSLEKEPIPGYLRAQWVKDFCSKFDNATVLDIREELPQFPEEHHDFWNIWCDLIKRSSPNGLDVIYTSEDYGFELAKRLGINHELVDKERIKVPISGTKIRNTPYENWKYIYQAARPYFMHRFYFLGPESTGKTTTSKFLAEKFESNWVPEYGRILFEKNAGTLEFMDFCEIVIKQREIENNLARNSQTTSIFCDTEVITTKVFCDLFFPKESHKLKEFFDFHIKKQLDNKCHFFVMSPEGAEAIQDGTRNFLDEEKRNAHFKKIIAELDKWKVSYTILNGTYDYRNSAIESSINKILKEDNFIFETID